MKNFILVALVLLTSSSVFCQKEFSSKKYNFKLKYPSNWDLMTGDNSEFTLIYDYQPKGRAKIAPAIDISVYPQRHSGKIPAMTAGYKRELFGRRDFQKQAIISEQIIDFDGIKTIDIIGKAAIPQVKQKLQWRILIFEYQKNYFEISFTATKADFKKKHIQAGYKMVFDSFEFTGDK